MDPLKVVERKILLWGTLAFIVLLVIDGLLFVKVLSVESKVSEIKPAQFRALHQHLDSLIMAHDAKQDSLVLDLRQRLGVDWPDWPPDPEPQ